MGFWHVYCGIYGGGGSAAPGVDVVTTRLTLAGSPLTRLKVIGSSR